MLRDLSFLPIAIPTTQDFQTRSSIYKSPKFLLRKMNQLSNAFSFLELDVADVEDSRAIDVSYNEIKSEAKKDITADTTLSNDENNTDQTATGTPEDYKQPLVWIDLEMTGLNVEEDRILEIACIITDGNLTKSVEGPDLVIHQTKECLDKMGEWCQSHHGESGLTKRVLQSKLSEEEAEKQVMEFVKKNVGAHTPLLAGNSVYVDLVFLKKYMPKLASLVPHVLVDVSSIKALCIRWYPRDNKKAPQKTNKHRALDDIKESIAELKYYKDNIFKPKSRK